MYIKINCIISDPPQIKATEQQGQNFGQGNYTYIYDKIRSLALLSLVSLILAT